MARRNYGANQDLDPYRRSGRSVIQVQAHPRPYVPANHSQPPPHDPSEDGADSSPRRRIALAVRVFSLVLPVQVATKADPVHSVNDVERGRSSAVVMMMERAV